MDQWTEAFSIRNKNPGQDSRLCASGNSLSFKVWALYHVKAKADKDYSLLWHWNKTIVFVSLLFSFNYKVNESLTNDNWHHQFPVRSFLVIQWISEPVIWSPVTVLIIKCIDVNWRVIDLQYCPAFSQTSAWTDVLVPSHLHLLIMGPGENYLPSPSHFIFINTTRWS